MISSIDQYGIKDYKWWYLLLLPVVSLYLYIQGAGYILWLLEKDAVGANILLYTDAKWVVQMAASTIGFGDFYPVTENGRNMVATSFYYGMATLGFLSTVLGSKLWSFFDNSIANRELRKQNDDILKAIKELKRTNNG